MFSSYMPSITGLFSMASGSDNNTQTASNKTDKRTLQQLIDLKPKLVNSENTWLRRCAKNMFIEKGADGLHQIKRDFLESDYLLMGQANLGLSPEDLDNIKNNPTMADGLITKQLINVLGEEAAKHFIMAHSQGPAAFIPEIIARPADADIQIKQSKKRIVNLIKLDGIVKYEIIFEKGFPIHNINEAFKMGTFSGPVKITFNLKQINDEVWGFELDTVETGNPDIIKMIEGEILSEEYIINKYCHSEKKSTFTLSKSKERQTPASIAKVNIGRFFKKNYPFEGITRSEALLPDKTQTISAGIVFYTFIDNKNGGYIHAFYPTCDDDHSDHERISLRHALEIYKKYIASVKKDDTPKRHQLVIPLATTKIRHHWFELFITINRENQVTARLTDPQRIGPYLGIPSNRFINTESYFTIPYVEKVIKDIFDTSLINVSLDQQSLRDTIECGYWYWVNSNASLGFAKTPKAIDDDILKKYRALENKYIPKNGSDERLIPTNPYHTFSPPPNKKIIDTIISLTSSVIKEELPVQQEKEAELHQQEERKQQEEAKLRKQAEQQQKEEMERQRLEEERILKEEVEHQRLEKERILKEEETELSNQEALLQKEETEPLPLKQPAVISLKNQPGFISRHRSGIIGGLSGTGIGILLTSLIITGVIFIPATFGLSAIISVSLIIGGALLGSSAGMWIDNHRQPSPGQTITIKNPYTLFGAESLTTQPQQDQIPTGIKKTCQKENTTYRNGHPFWHSLSRVKSFLLPHMREKNDIAYRR